MIRTVIDTNVFVSGVFWKGPPYKILKAWTLGQFKMIVTSSILNEYERVLLELAKKYNFSNYESILELVKINIELVAPMRFARPVCRDKDDDKFLSAALVGNAAFIVSGDLDLLAVNGFKGIKVVTPKQFLLEIEH